MQRMCVPIIITLIMTQLIFIQTKGNNEEIVNVVPSSAPENGLLPSPTECLRHLKTIPNCIDAVIHFRFKEVTKKCCAVFLGVSDECLGALFSDPVITALKWTCKLIG
ncbi:unnamed protein product [Cochlearia groenlandica]